MLKLEEPRGFLISSVTREEIEKITQDVSPKPCVGHYTVNRSPVEKSPYCAFFERSPREKSPKNNDLTPICEKLKYFIKALIITKNRRNLGRNKDEINQLRLLDKINRSKELEEKLHPKEKSNFESYLESPHEKNSSSKCTFTPKRKSVSNVLQKLAKCGSVSKITSSTPVRLGYQIEETFDSHHIFDSGKPRIEPNIIPEKPRGHPSSIDFSKLPRRRHHYEDFPSPCEKRFDNINRLPAILSNSGHVAKYDIGKISPRKMVYPKCQVPCIYNPNKEAVLKNESYGIFQYLIK